MSPMAKNCPCEACFSERVVPLRRALEVVADSERSNRIVDVIDGDNTHRFEPGLVPGNHFWSTNGVECLWCARQRTPDEIARWFAAGKPGEVCRP